MKEVGGAFVGDSVYETDGLRMLLWRHDDGALYEVVRKESDKPRALTCSGEEYLRSLHATFHHASLNSPGCDLSVSIEEDAAKNELVVSVREDRDGMNLRYDSWSMPRRHANGSAAEAEIRQRWCAEFAVEEAKVLALQRRVAEFEGLVQTSDALVTKAIAAKEEVESRLVQQCVTLLNTKKAEIQRLQSSSKGSTRRRVASPPESDDEPTASSDEEREDEAAIASQAYSQVPVTQTHVTAKQVLDGADDEFLDML